MDNADMDDASLASAVRAWIASGESEQMEFKVEFPKQAAKFAREIAAFATSGAGRILLGVSDAGGVEGLPGLETQSGRDLLTSRIEGLCASIIQPTVSPMVRFCTVEGKAIVVVFVPKGPEPVYYADNVPYLRQITASRAADPREVRDLMEAWLRQQGINNQPSPETQYFTNLLQLLVSILSHTEDATSEAREVDPWFSEIRHRMEMYASQARDFAASAPLDFVEITEELDALAAFLEGVAHEQIGIGFGRDEVVQGIANSRGVAVAIKIKWLDEHLAKSSPTELEEEIRVLGRKLDGVARRAVATINRNGGVSELRGACGEFGIALIRAGTFGIGFGGVEGQHALRRIGTALRKAEAQELFFDGGASVRAVVKAVEDASRALNEILSRLAKSETARAPAALA